MSSRDEYAQPIFSGRLEVNRGEPSDAEIDDEVVSASSQEDLDGDASPAPRSGRSMEVKQMAMINKVWTYNKAGSTNPPELFDDIQCISLEYHYQCYDKAGAQEKQGHRYVQIDLDTVIDLSTMKEKRDDGAQGMVVQRPEDSEDAPRARPNSIYQADHSKHTFAKQGGSEGENSLAYDFDKFTWLAEAWFKSNGAARYPSRNQIVRGVIAADKQEIIRLNPQAADATKANVKNFFAQREEAWKLVFEYSDFFIRNMDAPIDAG